MAALYCVKTENRGRICVSKSDFHRGELILTEEPNACVLSDKKRGLLCDSCLCESAASLQRCSGCKFVRYCSRACQKEDWSRAHKLECRCLKRVLPRTPPDLARLLAHVCLMRQKDRGDNVSPQESDHDGFPSTFDGLQSHHEALSALRIEHFESCLFVLQQYLGRDGMPESVEMLRMFSAMVCNSFSICNNDMNDVGVGIYLRASMLNHSCDPNCVMVFEGRKLHLRSVKDIKKGDECTITYVDLITSKSECQAELQERYHFTCGCSRCQNPSESWNNNDCDMEITTRLKKTLEEVEEAKKSQDWSTVKRLSEPFLKEKQKLDIPPHHHLWVKLRDAGFDACVHTQDWEKAAAFGHENTESYRFHYGPFHPSMGIHLLRVGKLLLYQGEVPEATKCLREAEAIIAVTHGSKHPLIATLKELQANAKAASVLTPEMIRTMTAQQSTLNST